MYRVLTLDRKTKLLYFASIAPRNESRELIVWVYDNELPKREILTSLFDLIVSNFDDIRDIEDLKILDNELHFDLDLFNKFNTLLKMQKQLKDYEDKYNLFKEDVLSCVRKLEKTDIGPNGFGSTGTK